MWPEQHQHLYLVLTLQPCLIHCLGLLENSSANLSLALCIVHNNIEGPEITQRLGYAERGEILLYSKLYGTYYDSNTDIIKLFLF